MISSVITYRASPCGLGAPSGAILMALGALLPFSIIMWTTGATAQSKTSQQAFFGSLLQRGCSFEMKE
ncbi:hypothetical protein GN956_G14786 [Arapaima gigas]